MVKKIILIFIMFLTLLLVIGIFYLKYYVIPTQLKAAIVEGAERFTGKRVSLGAVRFSIFKGLILEKLAIYEHDKIMVSAKEADCLILAKPFFKKEILIPSIKLESPEVFIERRKDGSFNISELMRQGDVAEGQFRIVVSRVMLRNASVTFRDDNIEPAFMKVLNNLESTIYLSLPASIRYEVQFGITDDPRFKMRSKGSYDIAKKEFEADIDIKDLVPRLIAPYYEKSAFSMPEGMVDGILHMIAGQEEIKAETEWHTLGLVLSKEKMSAKIDSSMNLAFSYGLADKKLSYVGALMIKGMTVSGIDSVGELEDIKGDFAFSNSGLSSQNVTGRILSVPVSANIKVSDYANPKINIGIDASVGLAELESKLKSAFNMKLPASIDGSGRLHLALQYDLPNPNPASLEGQLDITDARLAIGAGGPVLENVNGNVKFTPNQIIWQDAVFNYMNTAYKSSGVLTNLEMPGLQIELHSKDIDINAIMSISGKLMKFSRFVARYRDSDISAHGDVDMSQGPMLYADMSGEADINLGDIKEPLKKYKERLDKIRPAGRIGGDFSITGNLKDLRHCSISAKLSSESLSLYGLKYSKVFANYRQKNGFADILFLHAFLYEGTLEGSARIDLISGNNPYNIDAEVKDVKIERLKEDAGFKDKDIAGSIHVKTKIMGLVNDPSAFSGSGKIVISKGKLWQLNLFKGLGVLLFTSDFSNIIFSDGSCDFYIKEKVAYTDDLQLKSEPINLYGSIKLDFNNTIAATLKAEIKDEAYLSETKQNLAETLGKYTYIDISGTLKEPQYRIKPDIGNIIDDIKERFFQS